MRKGALLIDQQKKGSMEMGYCELCKQRASTPGMSMLLRDVNGNMTAQLCQPCLKKLKNAVRSPKPQVVDIYPVTNKDGAK